MTPRECPYCGAKCGIVKKAAALSGKTYDYYVQCQHCQATGPRFNASEEKAIEAYNFRKDGK